MLQVLYKYIILNNKAVIPGVGIFYIDRQPARLDYGNKVFTSPSGQIAFKNDNSAIDKHFYAFLSQEKDVEEEKAIQLFDEFLNKLKKHFYNKPELELPGLGVLIKNEAGNYEFTASTPLKTYNAEVTAERVIRADVEHNILVGDTSRTNVEMQELLTKPKSVKDYWWVFAIILALIGIAAMVYYYMQNGSFE